MNQTRPSHRPATAARDMPQSAAFSPVGLLDVPSSTTPQPSGRKHPISRHLAALATRRGEKSALETPQRKRLTAIASFMAWLIILAACKQPPLEPAAGEAAVPRPTAIPLPQAVLPDGFAVNLELALTPEETSNGLMFRPTLPENRGMLFLFDEPRVPTFWMKNTLIPLDLVFLDGAGVVVDVVANVQPCAAEPCPNYPPSSPALAVLEIVAGGAAAHGLEPGALIHFERVPGYPVPAEE